MARLEESKQRLERALVRLEQSVAKAQNLRDENQSLVRALDSIHATEQQLRTAAADALAEVDQAIALIAAQASTEGERVEPVGSLMLHTDMQAAADAPELTQDIVHDPASLALQAGADVDLVSNSGDDTEVNVDIDVDPEPFAARRSAGPTTSSNDQEEAEDAYQAGLELWATASPTLASSPSTSMNGNQSISEVDAALPENEELSDHLADDDDATGDDVSDPPLESPELDVPDESFEADEIDLVEDEGPDDTDAYLSDDVDGEVDIASDPEFDNDSHEPADDTEDDLDEARDLEVDEGEGHEESDWDLNALTDEEAPTDDSIDDESAHDKKSQDGPGGSWSFLDD